MTEPQSKIANKQSVQTLAAGLNLDDREKARLPSVLLPMVLFVLFDCMALGLNYWISYRLTENALAINLAGRQRMLTQRMTKALFNIDIDQIVTPGKKLNAYAEFTQAEKLFDRTLQGFLQGGPTLDGNGQEILLHPIEEQTAKVYLIKGIQLWSQVQQDLRPLLEQQSIGRQQLLIAQNSLKKYNLQLLGLMNKLTLALEKNSAAESGYLRIVQATVLVFALINFFLIYRRLLLGLKLSQSNTEALKGVIDSIDTAIVLHLQDGSLKSANSTAMKMFSFSPTGLKGKRIEHILHQTEHGYLGIRRDGITFKAEVNCQQLYESDEPITVCTIIDVSQQKQKEEELLALAFHDELTGLPNRLLLKERMQQEILHAKRNKTLLAVLFLDLDGFKEVNDNLGHDAGDELLKMVAKRLLQCCREDDTVARLGGDEFVVLLGPIHSRNIAENVAANIIARLNKDFLLQDHKVAIGVSIGIAFFPDDHDEGDLLLRYADEAMYESKKKGKNRYCLSSSVKQDDQ